MEGQEEGMTRGMAKGMEKGEKRKALEVAFKIKQMGMTLEEVMAITGLTRAEVETVG
jgi:predicted transposase/invertase (TIGR01784 family)